MRKVLFILALTAVAVMASAGDAFAQRRGGGGGGRGGYSGGGYGGGSGWGITIGNGGVRYYNGDNYNRGYYSPYTYGSRYYSTPYYYGNQYYYSDPIVQPAYEIQQTYYAEPVVSQQAATVVVLLPRADAQVWFDGAATSQQGMERSFVSPPLQPGTYTYTIRARWMENGQSFERERQVNVQRGQSVTLSFRGDTGETLKAPPRSK